MGRREFGRQILGRHLKHGLPTASPQGASCTSSKQQKNPAAGEERMLCLFSGPATSRDSGAGDHDQ